MALPSPLPDSPTKWDGWKNYNSTNPYERLCLAFEANPSDFQIEENCRQLLVWWQKKLPLKNQPSNPLTQLLRNGLDEAPRFLAEARMELLDAAARARVDDHLRARMKEKATAEFVKFFSFAVTGGALSPADEANLYKLGQESGLSREELTGIIEAELARTGASRYVPPPPPPVPEPLVALRAGSSKGASPSDEFRRMLLLTGLKDDDMTDDQRDALCNMGENLGLSGGEAEDLIDEYLELDAPKPKPPPAPVRPVKKEAPPAAKSAPAPERRVPEQNAFSRAQERAKYPNFKNILGMEMLLVQSGSFFMGSTAYEAAPNEQPVSKVTLSCFYMSRFPVTNADYEQFDPRHASKRAQGAGGNHPVIHVTSLEAMEFCRRLSLRERRKYRLPTEAEWEYAARGMDGRSYPWGEGLERGDLANLADVNTAFAWRDPNINDGYAETAPVGSYPRGASPFGLEDMAGNIWEWCSDFFEAYKGKEAKNPRGPMNGARRVYRGGSWKSRGTSLRATTRNFNMCAYSSNDVGFRIVCECE